MLTLMQSEYRSLTNGESVAVLDQWVAYRVSGVDALDWFQGQATNDLRSLSAGNVLIESCLCSATGQLTALFAVGSFGDQLYLLTPLACEAEILARVEKMVILEEVELEKTGLGVAISGASAKVSDTAHWPTRLLGAENMVLHLLTQEATDPFPKLSQESIDALHILGGTPRFGSDTHAKTLPPELGPDFDARFVHYSKGCYMWQEVLQRIHSRGHTNKTWIQIEVKDARDLCSPLMLPDFPTVSVTSEVRLDTGEIYLGAVLRNDSFEYGDSVKVSDSAGRVGAGTILGMPIYPFA